MFHNGKKKTEKRKVLNGFFKDLVALLSWTLLLFFISLGKKNNKEKSSIIFFKYVKPTRKLQMYILNGSYWRKFSFRKWNCLLKVHLFSIFYFLRCEGNKNALLPHILMAKNWSGNGWKSFILCSINCSFTP